MLRFIVEGGKPLSGTIAISGSKNAALPAMCAALLADTPTTLTNVPDIVDVHTLAKIMIALGASVEQLDRHTWRLNGQGLNKTEVDTALGQKLRASILLLAPLLVRCGEITLPHPGGDLIGKRQVATHFDALKALGADVTTANDHYHLTTRGLRGAYLYLDEVSVTATENAIMAAVLAAGETTIRPAAMEPHVVCLCELLVEMGARIEGIGTHTLTIIGVTELHGVTHEVISDEIETGTFAVAAAITKGELTLTNTPNDLDPIVYKLKDMGIEVNQSQGTLHVAYAGVLKATRIQVDTWPRFPTDLQPQFTTLATQAEGDTPVHEWMYEKRLDYTKSLSAMGADIELIGPHHVLVHGPRQLHEAVIDSPDLRSGIAFVLAAFTARGQSQIRHAELILRGYEHLVERLQSIGGVIREEEVED